MEEQLISFETAKLAFEKGFPHKDSTTHEAYHVNGELGSIFKSDKPYTILAPTQSLLQKWLRKEYDIFVETRTYINNGLFKHMFVVKTTIDYEFEVRDIGENYPSIEEALEQGLQEALKLI